MKKQNQKQKIEAIKDARSYVLNNWEGIMNQYDPDYIGCSTEGHISHILSARLSSRPLSWCREGVDQMSRLRAFKANSGNVYDLVKERSKKNRNKNHKIRKPYYKKATNLISDEKFGNVPVVLIGKRTWKRELFKRIASAI